MIPSSTALRALIALGVVVILLTGLAQLILPPLAAEDVRDKVGRYGSVQSVSISAWPALTLLWRSAGSLSLRARRLALTPSRSVQLLGEASGIDRLDATVAALREGPLALQAVRVHKRGSSIVAEGLVSAAQLSAALPGGVVPLGKAAGGIRASVAGSLFGRRGRIAALVRPLGGRLVVEVPGRRLTLFADRRLRITGVGYSPAPGGYRVWLTARLA